MEKEPHTSAYGWITFLAVLLLITGVYASVRTAINLIVYDKYPQSGVISSNLFSAAYYPREQDCESMYVQPYDDRMYEKMPISVSESGSESAIPVKDEKVESVDKEMIIDPGVPPPYYPPPDYGNKQKEMCLQNIKDSRNEAKTTDLANSFLFLLLGSGLLTTRKKFFS